MKRSLFIVSLLLVVLCYSVDTKAGEQNKAYLGHLETNHVQVDLKGQLKATLDNFQDLVGKTWHRRRLSKTLSTQFTIIMEDFLRQLAAGREVVAGAIHFNMVMHEKMFVDAITLFLTRVRADEADLRAAFGLQVGFRIADMKCFSNDPHHLQRRVIIFKTNLDAEVVYKPASQDASFVFGSNDASSFLSLYNQWIPDPYKLYTFPVVRKNDGEGAYGYIDFISKESTINDFGELGYYSYTAGLLSAAMTVCGVTDMHVENMMTHKATTVNTPTGVVSNIQPVVIDAETMMNPDPDFPLVRIGIFTGNNAGFGNYKLFHPDDPNDVFEGDANSVIVYKGVVAHPINIKKFLEGYKFGFDALGTNKDEVLDWFDEAALDGTYYRFIPMPTSKMREFNCNNLISGGGMACKDNVPTTEWSNDYKWGMMGLLRDDCAYLKSEFLDTDDIATVYLKWDSAKIYFPDLTTELSFEGLPDLTTLTTPAGFFAGKVTNVLQDDTTDTDLLGDTLKDIVMTRVDGMLQDDGSIPAPILAEIEAMLEEQGDIIEAIEYP